jgi:hypothetical protein
MRITSVRLGEDGVQLKNEGYRKTYQMDFAEICTWRLALADCANLHYRLVEVIMWEFAEAEMPERNENGNIDEVDVG